MRTSGDILKEITKEIQYIRQRLPEVKEVYGFGSFFRGVPFNDIDLLFVVSDNPVSLLSTSRTIRLLVSDSARRMLFILHPLILTEREFEEAPLRDTSELVPLSNRLGSTRPR